MADNFNINQAESGTLTPMASDDVSDVHYPRVKVGHGVDGAYSDTSDTAPLPVKPMPQTSGGVSQHHKKAAASTNATSVKASAGQLYGFTAFNASGATKYLKFYDKATAPTVGTDTPVAVYPLAAGENLSVNLGPHGRPFANGIGYGITGALADNDTTAVAANDVVLNLEYK